MVNQRVLLALALGLSACNAATTSSGAEQGVAVDVQPQAPQVLPGGAVSFATTVTGTANTSVTWRVVQSGGGTIDATGHYTAPQTTGQYQVTATSVADPTAQGSATVTVTATPVVAVSISPSSASVQTGGTTTFTAIVTGTTNTAVTWSLQEANCGSITQAGVYTAPASAGTCHVVATSAADSTKSAVAAVTVFAAPPSGSCAGEPLRATGTIHYFCDCGTGAATGCVAGNNANAGTSPSAPKQTGSKALLKTIPAGDTIALCRGGAFGDWDGSQTNNTNCRAASTCDVRDYTPAAHPEWAPDQTKRPIINADRLAYWVNGTANQGFRFLNLDVRSPGEAQGAVMSDDATTDVDFCNVRFYDVWMGLYIMGSANSQRWTIRQSQFELVGRLATSAAHGILGGCTDCTVDNNWFAANAYGSNGYFDHQLYLTDWSGQGIWRMHVTNNEIHGCGRSNDTVTLVVHAHYLDLLIENNLIQCDAPASHGGSQWGIQLNNGGYGSQTYFDRTVIRRNWIVDQPGLGVALSTAPNSFIEDNVVVVPANGGDGIVDGMDAAIATYGDHVNNAQTVRNNTVYFRSGANGTAVTIGVEGTGHVATNNVAWYESSGSTCWSFPLSAGSYTLIANDACNRTWGTSYDTGRVVLTANPFANSAGLDFTPAAGSPLVNAGSTANYSPVAVGVAPWSASDPGKARDAQPDIGAFER